MIESMQKSIEKLRERVNLNLEVIKENQRKIRRYLESPVSSERTQRIEQESSVNKKLLAENHEFINMQISMINFIEKYKPVTVSATEEEITFDEHTNYFELTVEGKIPFNVKHPKFNDKEFYTNLMEYYIERENYEMCEKLSHYKN